MRVRRTTSKPLLRSRRATSRTTLLTRVTSNLEAFLMPRTTLLRAELESPTETSKIKKQRLRTTRLRTSKTFLTTTMSLKGRLRTTRKPWRIYPTEVRRLSS